MIKELTKESFGEFISSESKVLVDFWATWCGPCQIQGKMLHEAAEQDPAFGAKVGKINVDEAQQLSVTYGIRSIPTLLLFKGGQVVDTAIGALAKNELKALIDKNL